MEEGFHYYHLTIDGGVFNDPGTHNYYGSTRWESGVEVPAHDADFYAMKDVPHGKVSQILYPSKTTTAWSSAALLFTRPRAMTRTLPPATQCSICNTAGEKMRPHGGIKATPTRSWTT